MYNTLTIQTESTISFFNLFNPACQSIGQVEATFTRGDASALVRISDIKDEYDDADTGAGAVIQMEQDAESSLLLLDDIYSFLRQVPTLDHITAIITPSLDYLFPSAAGWERHSLSGESQTILTNRNIPAPRI